jgi:hypothetical protein
LLIQAITIHLFLLPRYLVKAKWLKLTTGILVLCIIIVIAGYCVHGWLFPCVDAIFNNPPAKTSLPVLWSSISAGLLNTPKVVGAAAAIKLIKLVVETERKGATGKKKNRHRTAIAESADTSWFFI